MDKKISRILSGVQPTGNLHLGNYLGAIRHWVKLHRQAECLFMLADLHAITVPQDPAKLRAQTRETAAAYIACGIDPERAAIFHQSAVPAHAELAWILSCHTPLGWLNRMTQFKEKVQASKMGIENLIKNAKTVIKSIEQVQNEIKSAPPSIGAFSLLANSQNWQFLHESTKILKNLIQVATRDLENVGNANLGLYSYPVLMAADILVYRASHVPVGHDQKQHLELARDVAGAFNRHYKQELFPLPEPLILGEATRVMSLRDGTKKMSKSDESDYSRINLTDDADAIAKKFKKAKSDATPGITYDPEQRPEASNLLAIYASLRDMTLEAAQDECAGMNFAAFKTRLADVAVAHLAPISIKMRELLKEEDYLDGILVKGVAKANAAAGDTMRQVKDIVGFLNLKP